VPTPHYGTPRYRRVADQLRDRITSGAIPPGALLPAETALAKEFNVARGTIRAAINALREDGLVTTEHGRGTYTQSSSLQQDSPRDTARYSRTSTGQAPSGSLGTEPTIGRIIALAADQVDTKSKEVAADAELAALVQCELGAKLTERRTIYKSSGVPQQMETSYSSIPCNAEPSPTDNTHKPPPDVPSVKPGITRARVWIVETVQARLPTASEAKLLNIDDTTPVLAILRRIYSQHQSDRSTSTIVIPNPIATVYEFSSHIDRATSRFR